MDNGNGGEKCVWNKPKWQRNREWEEEREKNDKENAQQDGRAKIRDTTYNCKKKKQQKYAHDRKRLKIVI